MSKKTLSKKEQRNQKNGLGKTLNLPTVTKQKPITVESFNQTINKAEDDLTDLANTKYADFADKLIVALRELKKPDEGKLTELTAMMEKAEKASELFYLVDEFEGVAACKEIADVLPTVQEAKDALDDIGTDPGELDRLILAVQNLGTVAQDAKNAINGLVAKIKEVRNRFLNATQYLDVVNSLTAATTAETFLGKDSTTILTMKAQLILVTNAFSAVGDVIGADNALKAMATAANLAGAEKLGVTCLDNGLKNVLDVKNLEVQNAPAPETLASAAAKLRAEQYKVWYDGHANRVKGVKVLIAAGSGLGSGNQTWATLFERFNAEISVLPAVNTVSTGDINAGVNTLKVKVTDLFNPLRLGDAVLALQTFETELKDYEQQLSINKVKVALETVGKLLEGAKQTSATLPQNIDKLEIATKKLRDETVPPLTRYFAFRKKVEDAEAKFAPLLKIQTLNATVKVPLNKLSDVKNNPESFFKNPVANADAQIGNIEIASKVALDTYKHLEAIQARAERIGESDLVNGSKNKERKEKVEQLINDVQEVFNKPNFTIEAIQNAVVKYSKMLEECLEGTNKAATDFDSEPQDTGERDLKRWDLALREVGTFINRLTNIKDKITLALNENANDEGLTNLLARCVTANQNSLDLKFKLDVGNTPKPLDQLPTHLGALAQLGATTLDIEQAVKRLGAEDEVAGEGTINAITYTTRAKSITDCFDGPSLLAQIAEYKLDDQHAKAKDGVIPPNVPLHRHLNGGSAGVAFAYILEENRSITPKVYDYAPRREGNKYDWLKGEMDSGPPRIS